jgi:hypothetical protein
MPRRLPGKSVLVLSRQEHRNADIACQIGRKNQRSVEQLLEVIANVEDTRLPEVARACVAALGTQLQALSIRPAAAALRGLRFSVKSWD